MVKTIRSYKGRELSLFRGKEGPVDIESLILETLIVDLVQKINVLVR